MNPLCTAVLKSGLVSEEMFAELRRFGSFPDVPEDLPKVTSFDEAISLLRDALESEGYVLTRETDLEALQVFLATQKPGSLHVEIDGVTSTFPITYGRTSTGEYIIPWKSESIKSEMTNGLTHLLDGDHRVFFHDVRELFFGPHKTFMVCTASTVEASHGTP